MEDRCYVVSAIGMKPLKIRGSRNKEKLLKKLRALDYKPRVSRLNPNSESGKACRTKPTRYL